MTFCCIKTFTACYIPIL